MEANYLYEVVALVLLVGAALAFFILPDRHERKRLARQVVALTPGDRVTAKSGLVGTVVSVDDGLVVIETGPDKVRLELALWGVASVEAPAETGRDVFDRVAGRTAERAR